MHEFSTTDTEDAAVRRLRCEFGGDADSHRSGVPPPGELGSAGIGFAV